MLRYNPTLTPQEKRARRVRLVFAAGFFFFLLAVLLAVAYTGFLATRRQPVHQLRFAQPPTGVLTFSLAGSAEAAKVLLTEDNSRTATILEESLRTLRPALAPMGQLYFWKPATPDDNDRWVAFIPLVRTNRLYVQKVQRGLQSSRALRPRGEPASSDEQFIGYYEVTPKGILVSSEPDPAPHQFAVLDESGPTTPAYRTDTGYVPELLLSRLPQRVRRLTPPRAVASIVWLPTTASGGSSVEVRLTDNTVIKAPYFDPIIPDAGSPDE